MNVTFTLDLEDHRPSPHPRPRYPAMTYRVLDFLGERKVKGTFFVVGEIAEQNPALIRTIHQQGHEIAFHTYAHVPLTREDPARFREETYRSKTVLEDLIGEDVIGFRAPCFSLTPKSAWVLPVLSELGFLYSSSVLPMKYPLNSFPGVPQRVFRWKDSLIEIPVPLARVGSFAFPFLGGVYMRYLPDFLLLDLLRRNKEQALWTYCHPFDFDSEEGFCVMREASALASLIQWLNRRATFRKVGKILDQGAGLPFRDYLRRGAYESVPVYDLAVLGAEDRK